MKHNEHKTEYFELQGKMLDELRKCITAHGGKYEFKNEDGEYQGRPYINIVDKYFEGEGEVNSVEIKHGNSVIITAVDCETEKQKFIVYGDNLSVYELESICTAMNEP